MHMNKYICEEKNQLNTNGIVRTIVSNEHFFHHLTETHMRNIFSGPVMVF